MAEKKKEAERFLAVQSPGLFAIFVNQDGEEKKAPIVGYFVDEEGRHEAAILPSNGTATKVSDIKGLKFQQACWITTRVEATANGRTVKIPDLPDSSAGGSLFERIFGKNWWEK